MIPRLLQGRVFGTASWTAFSVAISALTGIFTARSLGPTDRGSLALVVSIAGICALVGALGTNVAVRRHLPRQSANRGGYYRVTVLLIVPLTIVLLAVTYLVATYVDPDFGDPAVGLAFIGYGIAYYFSNQWLDLLNAMGRLRTSSMVNALGTLFCFALVVPIALLHPSLALTAWAYTASVVAQVALSMVLIRLSRGPAERPRGARLLLRDGSRLLGFNVGQTLAYQGDTVLLGALSSSYQVGMYAVAVSPAAVLRIPSTALGQVLFHDVAAGATTKVAVLRRIAVLLAFLVPVAAVVWALAGWLIELVYGSSYGAAVEPFRILLVAELLLSPFIILGRTLAGIGRTWSASACGLLGLVLIVIFCLILVPSMGASGAALASAIAYGAMSALAIAMYISSPRPDPGVRTIGEIE